MFTSQYPSGADVQVYITPEGVASYEGVEPLDIRSILITEEGTNMPLFDYNNHIVKHFAYSTRMVSGSFELNVSERSARKFRVGSNYSPYGVQSIHNATMWVEITNVEWWPETKVTKDVLRIDNVWEQPFNHASPMGTYMESVPFTGRTMNVVTRQSRDLDQSLIAEFVNDSDRFILDGNNLIRSEQIETLVTILKVVDADTFLVQLPDGTRERVRLISIQAPEDPWKGTIDDDTNTRINTPPSCGVPLDEAALDADFFVNSPDYGVSRLDQDKQKQSLPSWEWPATAGELGGQRPTQEDLNLWGRYATCLITNKLEGKQAYMVQSVSVSPERSYGRLLRQLRGVDGFDPEKFLLEEGLAVRFTGQTEITLQDGQYTDRGALLDLIAEQARAAAGTADAKGVWKSFAPPSS